MTDRRNVARACDLVGWTCPTPATSTPARCGPGVHWGRTMGAGQQVIVPFPDASAAPDVSVVMPVHDMPLRLVRRAIRSVRRQDHPGPVEVVLWDDGSRDPALRAAYAAIAGSFVDAVAPVGERVIATFRTPE